MFGKWKAFFLMILPISCTTGPSPSSVAYKLPIDIKIANESGLEDLKMGGFSGLHIEAKNGHFIDLYTLTDRGPNGKKKDLNKNGVSERPFLVRAFNPQIIHFRYDLKSETLQMVETILLKNKKGQALSGLPNIAFKTGASSYDEEPVDVNWSPLKYDSQGIDPESITRDSQGYFWIGEEYGPSLLKFDKEGKLLTRYTPAGFSRRAGRKTLPSIFNKRRLNGGFEGLAIVNDKIYAFLQKSLHKKSQLIRVLQMDLNTGSSKIFLYQLSQAGNKIGGATNLPNGKIAVIEQNGDLFNSAYQMIFSVDFSKAQNVMGDERIYEKGQGLLNLQIATKRPLVDLAKAGLYGYEKLEGLGFTQEGNFFIVNDNDFNAKSLMSSSHKREENYLFKVQVKN